MTRTGLFIAILLGTSVSAGEMAAAQAPAQNACGLLTGEEVQALVPKDHASDGVPTSNAPVGFSACHYTWGVGADRVTLAISVTPASRMFAGMSADAIKQRLAASVVQGTADQAVSDVGEAAVFKAYGPAYVSGSALVKDRIVEVDVDGTDAIDLKGQVLSLLKSAASRL